jgi:hypothetical protein
LVRDGNGTWSVTGRADESDSTRLGGEDGKIAIRGDASSGAARLRVRWAA